jgi:hypothetical protein
VRRAPALLLACALVALLAGCGTAGVSSGATVSVYVSAPLCDAAKGELALDGGRAGDVHVRAICLLSTEAAGRLDLAIIGANARRTTEDSTSIAYIEESNPTAAKFSRPIVESADIAWITSSSGETAMARVLHAVSEADSSSLRSSVRDSLDGS